MDNISLSAGQVIFREGEQSDCAYIIVSGRVEIYKRVERGTVLLAELGQGEIFGEMGIISEQPRSAYASAAADTVLKKISREYLAQTLQGQPEEIVLIMKTLMERLRESSQKLTDMVNYQTASQVEDTSGVKDVKRVSIYPLTDVMKNMMDPKGLVITSLPFRVGALPAGEEPNPLDWNNLFISGGDATMISRNHFSIQRGAEGLFIMDRGSKTGTIVNKQAIGGESQKYKATLTFGDNMITAGTEDSPYRFLVVWE